MKRALPLFLVLTACSAPDPDPPGPEVLDLSFDDDFRFGVAVAQWQVEGDLGVSGPVDSNWSRWASMGRVDLEQQNPEGNGFHTRFAEDAQKAAALGLDTFRLGIDWSRVEPEPGIYDDGELDHLEEVLDALVSEDLDPVLTLWHWVVPTHIQSPDPDAGLVDLMVTDRALVLERWDGFLRQVIPRVKDRVDTYTVLNEPFSMTSAGYLAGLFPPGKLLQIDDGTQFTITLAHMQARAFDIIKELDDVDADGDGAASFVGFTMTANAFYPVNENSDNERFAADQVSYVFNDLFVRALVEGNLDVNLDGDSDDVDTNPPEGFYPELQGRTEFLGVQYYGPVRLKDDPIFRELHPLYGLPLYEVDDYDELAPHNGMKREIYAAGFRDTLDIYAKWNLPIILTENGTTRNRPPASDDTLEAELDEAQAAMYLVEHLAEVARAKAAGADIRGYYYWTITDNFEWAEGFRQRFGLFHLDTNTFARTRTVVADAYAEIVAARGIDQALFERWVLDNYPSDGRAAPGLTMRDAVPGYELSEDRPVFQTP